MKSESDKAFRRASPREGEPSEAVPDLTQAGTRRKRPSFKHAWDYARDLGPDDARFQEAIATQLSTLPVFPLYDIKIAAPLVGKTYGGMTTFLKKHKDKFPARYRVYGEGKTHRRLVRVLTAREVLEIRTYTLLGPGRFTQ